MKDLKRLCMGCMREKPNEGICPYCQFDLTKYETPVHQLRPETILNGKYLVGKALGEGGFGITYLGWDLNLEIPLAIKEFFPNGLVMRDVEKADTVSVFAGTRMEYFTKGKENFLREARVLAKFHDMGGVVAVKDFFSENGTAYIVMEYIEGEDFGHFLKRNGGKLPVENALEMMRPVMQALIAVHEKGLIHRDISPDNIMITKDSKIKLLDFGAAREMSGGEKSLSVMLKPGYAPEEQYRTRGQQGPWTDVYALCATLYRAITGVKPMESLDRMARDELKSPSQLGVLLNPRQEYAIMKGMAVLAQNRWQSMKELYDAIYEEGGEWKNSQMEMEEIPSSNVDPTIFDPMPTSKSERDFRSHSVGSPQKPVRNSNQTVILVLLAVLVFMVGAGSVMAMMALQRGKKEEAQETTVQDTTESTEEETEAVTETPRVEPVFTYATCSSIRNTDSKAGQYSVDAVLDDNPLTKWAPINTNRGIGEWIQINADTKQLVSGIRVANGYPKDYDTWEQNNRVKDCTISFSDGTELSLRMADQKEMQTIEFGREIETTYIRITIDSVYYGTKWKDVAIARIEAYN